MLEYVIIIHFSDADWDTPPGTGCVTVAGITISAILIVIKTLSTPQRGRDDEPQTDSRSGSLPSLDAAKDLLSAMPFRLRPDGCLA
jgi:hypothetical protein